MAKANRCGHCGGRFFVGRFTGKSAGIRCPHCARPTEVVKGKRWTRKMPLDRAQYKMSKHLPLTKSEREAVSARISVNVRKMMPAAMPAANAVLTKARGSYDPQARALAELATHYDPAIRAAAQATINQQRTGGA